MIRLPSTIARGALVAGLAGVLLGAACGGNGGTGAAGSSGGGTTGGSAAGTSGGGGTAGTGVAGTGVAGSGVAGSSAGTGGSTTGGAGTGGSTAGTGGSPAGTAGAGGSTAGTGGGTAGAAGGNAGRGGSAGGAAGQAGSAGRGGAAGTGQAGSSGSGGPPTCPTNATFCSGFEAAGMPTGAIYKVNAAPGDWTRDFAVDTAQKNSGSSSLRVKSGADAGTSGSAYKMLAVPATMNTFWVRFFIRSDMPIGSNDHNAFAVASLTDEPNDSSGVEFAEDVGVSFNASDVVRWPTGYGRLTNGSMMPYSLPANMWHCIEISFDGAARVQQLFVGGVSLINATDYPSATRAFKNFKFGFNSLHPPAQGPGRNTWYDDVAVAPTRVGGCP